jgi:hypothetical protein
MRRHGPAIGSADWGFAVVHAAPISFLILAAFYYWFAVADRYVIFLYAHLGAAAFDEVTSSRYWMSGLVASGALMVLYAGANWFVGRIAGWRHRDYQPPIWWRVWLLCMPPLAIGVPLITMTLNRPTLPASHAAACLFATLIGLALALTPGRSAAERPADLLWLALDGAGLMPSLLLLRAIELPGRGLVGPIPAYAVASGGTFAGIVWLVVVTCLREWRHKSCPPAGALLVSGLSLSYLFMPLVHHLLATPPGYRYISTASNFFALDVRLQLTAFLVAAILAVGITQLRRRLPSPAHRSTI